MTNPAQAKPWERAALLALMVAIYAAVILNTQGYSFGAGMIEMIFLPVAVAGWLFGVRGGLLAGMLAPLLVLWLLHKANAENGLAWLFDRGLGETVALIAIGAMVGSISSLQRRLHQQLDEHRKTELALAEANLVISQREETLRRVTDSMLDIVIEIDAGLDICYASPSCQAMIGYPAEMVTGQPVLNFIHPEDMGLAILIVEAALYRKEEIVSTTLRIRKAAGEVIWIEAIGKMSLDTQGQPYRAVFGVRDISARREAEEALRESEARYKPLFENHHTVMLLVDPASAQIVDANPAAVDFYGYSREVLRGMPVDQINILDEDTDQETLDFVGSSEHSNFFIRNRLASGALRDVEVYTTRVQVGGQPLLYSIVHDISERKRTEQAESEQREMAEALSDTAAILSSTLEQDEVLGRILANIGRVVPHNGVNIMLIDPNYSIIRVARGQGYENDRVGWKESVLGKSLFDIAGFQWMTENSAPLVIEDSLLYPEWKPLPESEWVRSYVGAPIYAHGNLVGFVNLDAKTPNFFNARSAERLQAFVDHAAVAIENARLYTALQQQALTDEVTRVYNRRGLYELGQREFDRSMRFHRSLSAIMLDIDYFKQVNDSHGHPIGDQVLRILCERCKGNIREVDILGRYGGEEFVILLVENDLNTAALIAERLRRSVDQFPFDTSAGSIHITVSLGAASINEDTPDLAALIEHADQALYVAKGRGRNRTVLER